MNILKINEILERYEDEKSKMKEEIRKVEERYVAQLGDKEVFFIFPSFFISFLAFLFLLSFFSLFKQSIFKRENNQTLSEANKRREEGIKELHHHQTKSLAQLKSQFKSLLNEKEKIITILSAKLEESNARVAAMDANIKGILSLFFLSLLLF